ncbi:MAG: thiolase family protein [Spirosomataceae bacterium]
MKNVFIVAAKRTPIGSFGGQFVGTSAVDLGVTAVKSIIDEYKIPANAVDELFFGHVCQANAGQAPARQVVIKSGISDKTPATTVNKVCASGMKSVVFGAQSIQLGQSDVVVAGGMENMSQIPFYLGKARYGYGFGNGELIDGLSKDGLTDVYHTQPMGCFADATAEKYGLSREQQDKYAIESYKRAAKANGNGSFKNEIVPVEIKDRKGNITIISEDEEFKKVKFEKIPTLRPVFSKDGTVTAANASTINDGAGALLLVSEEALEKYNIKPLAKIVSYADDAHEPEWFTTAPVESTKKALERASMKISDREYFEVNEAFSAVPMAFAKSFDVSHEKMNVLGGAVSLGHPLGCSGARILVTLLNVLTINDAKYGLAAICNGGGGASSMIIERL